MLTEFKCSSIMSTKEGGFEMNVLEIELLINRMQSKGVSRCLGRVQAFRKSLAFAFLMDTRTILISAVGQTAPLFVMKQVRDDFTVNGYIGDDYRRWKEYFGLENRGNKKFSLEAIWEQIRSQVAIIDLSKLPSYREILLASPYQADGEGIYFLKFRHNTPPASTSSKNYEKTCIAFGKEIADKLRDHNISTCWTAIPDEENRKPISKLMNELELF